MSNCKKLVVNITETLSDEFDRALEKDNKKRSEFIREAIILYIEEKKKVSKIDFMKNGYMEMAKINLELSELGFEKELKNLIQYETSLSESDLPNDDSEKRRYILC